MLLCSGQSVKGVADMTINYQQQQFVVPTLTGITPSKMSGGGDIDDSTTSAFSTNQQSAQKFLTIPGRIILDKMLTQLGFPPAQYQRTRYEDDKICVKL